MKILVVSNMFPDISHPSYGIFVRRFCNQLEEIGIDYDLSVMYQCDTIIFKIKNYIKFYANTFLKCIKNEYDFIYIHYVSHCSLPVWMASKLKKLVIISNTHGSDIIPNKKQQRFFQRYVKRILPISKYVIAPSEFFKKSIYEKYEIENPNKIVIYPSAGVEKKIFKKYSPNELCYKRKQYNFIEDNLYIGFCSRLINGKGWNVFIDAAKIVIGKCDKVRFVIVGNGEDENCLNNYIADNKMNEYIFRYDLLPQDKLVDIYNIIDLFVFPTMLQESLGLVAIEAMACGTPVISSNIGAPKFYVKDGYNGFKFDPGNYKQLAKILLNYVDGLYKKVELEQGALETAKEFSSDVAKEVLKNIFRGSV